MELDDMPEGAPASTLTSANSKGTGISQGQLFGIVQKMERSNRSFAKFGTVCEIQGHEQTQTIVFNPYERPSN